MSAPIITADGLGKMYRLGLYQEMRRNFREMVMHQVRAPFRRLKEMQVVNEEAADTFWALKDCSFDVEQGEIVGLIGRNGAGKSTLLKVLSRITEPTRGDAILRGRVASLLEVGTGFHPELTGRENIFLNGAILGMRRAEIKAKFDEIVAFSEIEKFLDTQVKRYSSGMYVRLAFAVAAHLEPEILIVDEVLAVGDAAFQKKCLGKMSEVVRHGRTVLFVSHSMDAVMSLCTQVYLLKGGRVSDRMPTAEGVKQYLAQVHEDSNAPLAQRPRYQMTNRPPIFTGLKIATPGEHENVVETGAPVTFELELSNCDDLKNFSVGVAILNDRNQRICLFHSEYNSNRLFSGGSRKSVFCNVPSLPLTPGSYFVELILADHYNVIERVERAENLTVVFNDFYGTGKIPNTHQAQVVLPCEWDEAK